MSTPPSLFAREKLIFVMLLDDFGPIFREFVFCTSKMKDEIFPIFQFSNVLDVLIERQNFSIQIIQMQPYESSQIITQSAKLKKAFRKSKSCNSEFCLVFRVSAIQNACAHVYKNFKIRKLLVIFIFRRKSLFFIQFNNNDNQTRAVVRSFINFSVNRIMEESNLSIGNL